MRVQLGNPAPKAAYVDQDGELAHRPVDGARVTTVIVPDEYTLIEALSAVVAQDGAWNHHSAGSEPADTRPDWVECDNPALQLLLEAHFGLEPGGRPASWKGLG